MRNGWWREMLLADWADLARSIEQGWDSRIDGCPFWIDDGTTLSMRSGICTGSGVETWKRDRRQKSGLGSVFLSFLLFFPLLHNILSLLFSFLFESVFIFFLSASFSSLAVDRRGHGEVG